MKKIEKNGIGLSLGALLLMSLASNAMGAEEAVKVIYKSGKAENFEELLIQGQLKRPDISVVTGNTSEGTNGLLRLRENFLDRVAVDQGEEIQ